MDVLTNLFTNWPVYEKNVGHFVYAFENHVTVGLGQTGSKTKRKSPHSPNCPNMIRSREDKLCMTNAFYLIGKVVFTIHKV